MTTQRVDCGLLCYPPTGSLIAIGGNDLEHIFGNLLRRNRRRILRRNRDEIGESPYSVELLRNGNCNQWQRLASIPFARGRPRVEYFRDRIFVFVGAGIRALPTGFLLMSSPPGTDVIEQWISLSPIGRRLAAPTLLITCNDQLFSIVHWDLGKLELLIRAFSADMATTIFDFSLKDIATNRGCRNSALRKARIMRQAKIHNNICIYVLNAFLSVEYSIFFFQLNGDHNEWRLESVKRISLVGCVYCGAK